MASLKSLQKRYDNSLKNDDFYGAEQACQMMHRRLTQSKTSTDADKKQAYDILLGGSKKLLEKSQPQAGIALAILAVKHCVDYKTPVNEQSISQIISISTTFESNSSNLTEEGERERLRFLKAALAWSCTKDGSIQGATKHGNSKINTLIGHSASKINDFQLSQRCFIHSDDPKGFAKVLYSYTKQHTLQSEKALVLTGSILRYLLSENLNDANILRSNFAQLSGWNDVQNNSSRNHSDTPPLAHFCELLLKIVTLDSTAAPLFKRICDAYQSQLSRDPSFKEQLARIGQMYFNIQPPQPSGIAGMMGTMLRGMMNSNN